MNKINNPYKKNNYSQLILGAILFSVFIFVYFPVWKNLILAWNNSEEYSHGFLIVPISLYIIWSKRKKLSEIPVKPSGWGLAVTLFSLGLYVFSQLAGISTLSSVMMICTICGMVLTLYGIKFLREILFPLLFLLLMIPVPSQIYSSVTMPLQLFVSKISVGIASLINIPVLREGNVIHLPERTLEVVQACSGLRSIVSLLTLSIIFGYFTLKSSLLRSLLFIAGIPAAIFVNIIRVLLMVAAFYYFDYDLTKGTIHTVFGVVIFILAVFFIFIVQKILSIWEKWK
jgi:exosortase